MFLSAKFSIMPHSPKITQTSNMFKKQCDQQHEKEWMEAKDSLLGALEILHKPPKKTRATVYNEVVSQFQLSINWKRYPQLIKMFINKLNEDIGTQMVSYILFFSSFFFNLT